MIILLRIPARVVRSFFGQKERKRSGESYFSLAASTKIVYC